MWLLPFEKTFLNKCVCPHYEIYRNHQWKVRMKLKKMDQELFKESHLVSYLQLDSTCSLGMFN